jgi:hypothetical protein
VIWTRTFLPGEFSSSIDSVGREVLWMAPDDAMASYGDSDLWRYKFPIPLDEAFVQSGSWEDPEVYWMDLQAFPYDPDAHFGWRSSKNTWRSIATWGSGLEPYLGPWQGLYHRHPHPLAGLLIDLAFMLRSGPSSSVPSGAGARDEFGLRQNVPNPFAHKSEIRYGLARQGRVKIEIFDVKGEIVATLVDEVKPAGEHAIWWNGRDAAGKKVPSGVYFYRLKSGGRQATMKLILLR